jgi:hypothetical protein
MLNSSIEKKGSDSKYNAAPLGSEIGKSGCYHRMIKLLLYLIKLLSKDASFFTHYYSHNVYSVKIKLNLEAKNALEK